MVYILYVYIHIVIIYIYIVSISICVYIYIGDHDIFYCQAHNYLLGIMIYGCLHP